MLTDIIGIRFDREAPGLTFVNPGIGRGIDLIDAPVIALAPIEQDGKIIARAGLAGAHEQSAVRVGVVDIVEVSTEIDIMHIGVHSRRPA